MPANPFVLIVRVLSEFLDRHPFVGGSAVVLARQPDGRQLHSGPPMQPPAQPVFGPQPLGVEAPRDTAPATSTGGTLDRRQALPALSLHWARQAFRSPMPDRGRPFRSRVPGANNPKAGGAGIP